MSGALDHEPPITPNAIEDEQAGAVTRRIVLTGAAAATAIATVPAALDTPARAHSVDPNSREHMVLFVLLSSALTGIAANNFFFQLYGDPRDLHSFPTRRSSDPVALGADYRLGKQAMTQVRQAGTRLQATPDRKSTRLNSSHPVISYAVFCLK